MEEKVVWAPKTIDQLSPAGGRGKGEGGDFFQQKKTKRHWQVRIDEYNGME